MNDETDVRRANVMTTNPSADARRPSERGDGSYLTTVKDSISSDGRKASKKRRKVVEYKEPDGQDVTLEITRDAACGCVRLHFWWHPRDECDPDDEMEIMLPLDVFREIARFVCGDAL